MISEYIRILVGLYKDGRISKEELGFLMSSRDRISEDDREFLKERGLTDD